MATSSEVMGMLCPDGGWIMYDEDFDRITWVDNRPRCTKSEFQAGFAKYDAWKAEQDSKAESDKAALLAKLGITADEFKTLLGDN